MQFHFASAVLIVLTTTELTQAAMSTPRPQHLSISTQPQHLPNNTTLTTISTPSNPEYEEYPIPNSSLTLRLTLHLPLDRVAMKACLLSASVWVQAQYPQSAGMLTRDFEWKDATGALFYISSLSRRLAWEDVGNVLRGLKLDLVDQKRYLNVAFTVEERTTKTLIGVGRLEEYVTPKPTSTGTVQSA
ncbi:hypothetical protein N7G274_002261 [Stereocaulon virgatum]|uniref:Uncharacterized protein n=1 Tax=Stereocaulon virgatum TaxID=373712 RepID=A0ABR4AJ54_9LECA